MESSVFGHVANDSSPIFGNESEFSLNLSKVSEINCTSLSFDMPIIDRSESQFWRNDERLGKILITIETMTIIYALNLSLNQ
ncbi:hypothetical protein BpHYR1_002933 [Brachionus plicatilis]|uniref:Uncharacterized protein n=1 Tax=Brachionus plicatilis TaxID=10195 RepID=A0A3M7P4U9_BRAPC|nr:hypothetical protein BpHYR1_002933 [Brachionus plicatilis]